MLDEIAQVGAALFVVQANGNIDAGGHGLLAAIPLAIVLKVEYSDARAVRLMPFVFLGGALATGFAERRVRLRHSLPEQSFDFRK